MAAQPLLYTREQRRAVVVERPLERQVVRRVVHAEDAAGTVDVLEKQLRLAENIHRVEHLKAALAYPLGKRRTRLDHQRQQADILRVHRAERLRRADGVLAQ